MAKIRIQPKDADDFARARATARRALGRIYAHAGEIYIVRGLPNPTKLRHCLMNITSAPSAGEGPSPIDLGFPAEGVSRLTNSELSAFSGALHKWRKVINDRRGLRLIRPETRREIEEWESDITLIFKQLKQLYNLTRAGKSMASSVSPYIIPDEQMDKVEALFKHARWKLPELWLWYGHIVAWLSGPAGLKCYLESACHYFNPSVGVRAIVIEIKRHIKSIKQIRDNFLLNRSLDDEKSLKQVQSFLKPGRVKWLAQTDWECALDFVKSIYTQKIEPLINQLPNTERSLLLSRRGRKRFLRGWNLRPHDFWSILYHLDSRCDDFLDSKIVPFPYPDWLIAIVASLCAFESSAEIYFPSVFSLNFEDFEDNEDDERNRCDALAESIYAASCQPGFGKLISMLKNGILIRPKAELLMPVQKLLEAGASPDDVKWVFQLTEGGYNIDIENLSETPLAAAHVRQFIGNLKTAGVEVNENDARRLLKNIISAGDVAFLEAVNLWWSAMPVMALTKPFCKALKSAVLNLTYPSILKTPGMRDFLSKWMTPPSNLRPPAGWLRNVPVELENALGRLAYYQKLGGKSLVIPESISKLLSQPEREDAELEYLRRMEIQGKSDEKMRLRRQNLEARQSSTEPRFARSLKRDIDQCCAVAALSSLRDKVAECERKFFKNLFGINPPAYLDAGETNEIAQWIIGLNNQDKEACKQIMDCAQTHGPDYKKFLPANANWFNLALKHGLDIETWLNPPSEKLKTSTGREIIIRAAEDPFRIFLMGTYFKTCLSLNDSNSRAVLTNAYDANKTVIFVLECDGSVLGRKLVCINKDWKLVGFRTYLSIGGEEGIEIEKMIETYCGKLAGRICCRLANIGLPENLCGLFWYNDGMETWTREARAAAGDISIGTVAQTRQIETWLAETLAITGNECRELLQDWGLLPASWEDICTELSARTELAEEILARVALKRGDEHLAEEVFNHARSATGRMEALHSLAMLKKEDVISELIAYAPENLPEMSNVYWDRTTRILLDIGTESAYRALFRMDDYSLNPLWLIVAITKSANGRKGLIEYLMQGSSWLNNLSDEFILLLIHAVISVSAKPLPDSWIKELIMIGHKEKDTWYGDRTLMLAQWLPPLKNPQQSSLDTLLERIYASRNSCLEDKSSAGFFIRAAALIAIRNPCSDSIRFLHKYSVKEPVFLLSLAILEHKRFSNFICKTARTMIWNPAAVMAVFLCLGTDAGIKHLVGYCPDDKKYKEFLLKVKILFDTYSLLHFSDEHKSSYDMRYSYLCMPYIMHKLWTYLDKVQSGTATGYVSIFNKTKYYYDVLAGISSIGIVVPLLLAHARKGTKDAVIARQLRSLLRFQFSYTKTDYLILLAADCIAQGTLFRNPKKPRVFRTFPLRYQAIDLLSSSAFTEFLFNPDGSRTGLAEMKWELGDFEQGITLPFDLKLGRKLLELYKEKFSVQQLRKWCRPATELEKLLIENCLGSAEKLP